MIYQFKCRYHGIFEINQPISVEHKADCPACGLEMQRVYLPADHYWAGEAHNPDGSVQELPPVGGGPPTKWTHGFGPGKKKEG